MRRRRTRCAAILCAPSRTEENGMRRGAAEPVLVIDADDDVRDGLKMILDAAGWTVETAEDGREALNKIAAGMRPCIVLIDLMSPVMSGVEFRRELQGYPHLLPIPILAYAGLTNVRSNARQAVRGSAPLPAEIDRLIAAVRANCE
jgi:DNA-binding NtrC family response regulator